MRPPLEAINPLIQAKHNLSTTREVPCEHCGEPRIIKGNSSGIRHAVTTLAGYKTEDWGSLYHRCRNGIAHAFEDAMSLGAVLETETDRARQTLIAAVTDLLEVPEPDREFYRRKPLARREVFAVIRATVSVPPTAFDGRGPIPHFTLEATPLAREGTPGDGTTQRETVTFRPIAHNMPGATNPKVEVYFPDDPANRSLRTERAGDDSGDA